MLKLFTDTDTDITPAVAAEYGYSLISMPYSVDAKTVYPYVDFNEFEAHKFYDMLRNGVLPTTSAISKERYIEYFEPEFAAGNDILYVHFSRAMTVTFNAMDEAVAELKAKYPERGFHEIDTKGITTISYTIVREVGDLLKAGKSLEEVLRINSYICNLFITELNKKEAYGFWKSIVEDCGSCEGCRQGLYRECK